VGVVVRDLGVRFVYNLLHVYLSSAHVRVSATAIRTVSQMTKMKCQLDMEYLQPAGSLEGEWSPSILGPGSR
jgi:hypothetical protein